MESVVAQVDLLTAEITKGVYALSALYVLDVAFGILTATKKATAFIRPVIAVFGVSLVPSLVKFLAS